MKEEDPIEVAVMKKVEEMLPILKLAARGRHKGVEFKFDEEGNLEHITIPGLEKGDLS